MHVESITSLYSEIDGQEIIGNTFTQTNKYTVLFFNSRLGIFLFRKYIYVLVQLFYVFQKKIGLA